MNDLGGPAWAMVFVFECVKGAARGVVALDWVARGAEMERDQGAERGSFGKFLCETQSDGVVPSREAREARLCRERKSRVCQGAEV